MSSSVVVGSAWWLQLAATQQQVSEGLPCVPGGMGLRPARAVCPEPLLLAFRALRGSGCPAPLQPCVLSPPAESPGTRHRSEGDGGDLR